MDNFSHHKKLKADTTSTRTTPIGVLLPLVSVLFVVLLVCTISIWFSSTSPQFSDSGVSLQIERGMSVQKIADAAEEAGIVRSALFLYIILTYTYDPTRIYAGTYRFDEPHTVYEVAQKLARNDVDMSLLSLTLPEGITRKEIARIAEERIPEFDTDLFLELTKNNEGYLFPDTYFVPEDFKAEELVNLLAETFSTKFSQYSGAVASSTLTEYEILTLASLLEREANDEQSMKMVSGILQNRLNIGMALQADASIEYVLDKELQELTPEDLKTDTPYNTYLYPGLPPTPIGNPGMLAIQAVLEPLPSPFMFYITGNDGQFYYAKTFEQHKKNIREQL